MILSKTRPFLYKYSILTTFTDSKAKRAENAPNNQIQINNKKLVLQLHESLDFIRSHIFYVKLPHFIKTTSFLEKNYIMPPYKKLQPLIKAFIIFCCWKNRDPCHPHWLPCINPACTWLGLVPSERGQPGRICQWSNMHWGKAWPPVLDLRSAVNPKDSLTGR